MTFRLAAHCIAISEIDQEILARRQVTVVQCPNCHMKLGMGVTPVPALLAKGVNVALGTDGTASSNDLNMLKEARLAALIQKLHHGDPEIMAGDLPLRMATQNGAKALGWPTQRRNPARCACGPDSAERGQPALAPAARPGGKSVAQCAGRRRQSRDGGRPAG